MDALNIKMPDNRPIDGVSLIKMIDGKETKRIKPLPFMHKGKATWIQGDLKYITAGKKTTEVYNLKKDRFEENNLIAEYAEQALKMDKHIMNWNLSCKESHTGKDYSNADFKSVGKWSGLDVERREKKAKKGKKGKKGKKNKGKKKE
tara:strand:- start:261 stop:701 length:441 start_codon:yes stop_codon:yes gene_type:complete